MLEESEFLAQSGCPPRELENWLENSWSQHNIRAVLAGSSAVGPQPHLLVRYQENQATQRLFCPKEKLLRENGKEEALASLREYLAGRPWVESCDEVITQITSITAACATRELPTSEIKLLWLAVLIAIEALLRLQDRPYPGHLKRLHASAVAFEQVFRDRGNPSPQSKYSEAQVSSRRALSENHTPVLAGFPMLIEIALEVSSGELAAYMAEDVRLDTDQFLDMLHVLAHDGADPATVANPPGRIRAALARASGRREMIYRQRWQQPTPEQAGAVEDPKDVESMAITSADWEIGKRQLALPLDLMRAI